MRTPSRTRSVGTKVSQDEYARLEACAADKQLSISEWSRQTLLAAANAFEGTAGEQAILAEVIALRTIVANLIYTFTSASPAKARSPPNRCVRLSSVQTVPSRSGRLSYFPRLAGLGNQTLRKRLKVREEAH